MKRKGKKRNRDYLVRKQGAEGLETHAGLLFFLYLNSSISVTPPPPGFYVADVNAQKDSLLVMQTHCVPEDVTLHLPHEYGNVYSRKPSLVKQRDVIQSGPGCSPIG